MNMPGRKFTAGSEYRFGFNGQEKSTEIAEGLTTAEFWEYDGRIGRRWNLDPKPIFGISHYATFFNNPIRFNDVLGDSIPTTFTDQNGQKTNEIPSIVQNQSQQEYGVTLGYANGKLFKAGDYKTDKQVSKDAKADWESALGASNTEQKLYFGYNLASSLKPNGSFSDPIVKGSWLPLSNTAVIDLADFYPAGGEGPEGTTLSSTRSQNKLSSVDPLPIANQERMENLSRVIEHEFLGHGVKHLLDPPDGVNELGATETQVNVYRRQMNVPTKLTYQYASDVFSRPEVRTNLPITHKVSKKYYDVNGNEYEEYYDKRLLEKTQRLVNPN